MPLTLHRKPALRPQKQGRWPWLRQGGHGGPGGRRLQLVAARPAPRRRHSSAPVPIGISVSLSGDFSGDGLATKQGYETWAAFQNAHGGILGRQIKLTFLSDGSSPTQVITNYQKLITVNHVDFVMGPYSTLLTKPASAIANRYGDVMIEGIGGGPSVFSQGLHNVFDVSASAAYQLITFAKWLVATQQPETIAYASMTDLFLQPGWMAPQLSHGSRVQGVADELYPLETTTSRHRLGDRRVEGSGGVLGTAPRRLPVSSRT